MTPHHIIIESQDRLEDLQKDKLKALIEGDERKLFQLMELEFKLKNSWESGIRAENLTTKK